MSIDTSKLDHDIIFPEYHLHGDDQRPFYTSNPRNFFVACNKTSPLAVNAQLCAHERETPLVICGCGLRLLD